MRSTFASRRPKARKIEADEDEDDSSLNKSTDESSEGMYRCRSPSLKPFN